MSPSPIDGAVTTESPAIGMQKPSSAASVANMLTVAQLENVSQVYGTFAALRKITLQLEPARCYVLLGENGAGKSTLLRALGGLIRPTYGSIKVFEGIRPEEARGRIGYMSHAPMLYDQLSGAENLQYFASLYQKRECLTPEQALTAVGLDPALKRPISQYSQGMRQRASLARVLISQPELLLLDEPFSNMDITSARQMLALIERIREQGRTVVLTTHQRDLAEPIADYLVFLRAGALDSLQPGPAYAPSTAGAES